MINSYTVPYKYNSICLVSSAGCNLNCRYCEIARAAKNSGSHAAQLQNKIKAAFEDGSYLQNAVKTYEKLGQDLENIKCLNFWGQEPTLTFDSFRSRLEEWLEAFPNLNYIFFSTNGGTDPMILYNFICDFDRLIDHEIVIDIQFSFDGDWSCREQRGIDPDLIKAHFSELIEKLNSTLLKKVRVSFVWHGVLNFELIRHLSDNDLVADYLKELDDIAKWGATLIENPRCSGNPTSIAIEQPYKASTEDGYLLATFLDKSLRAHFKHDFYFENPIKSMMHQLTGAINNHTDIFMDDRWIPTLFDTLNNTRSYEGAPSFFDGVFCGSYRTELKLAYDGTILGCQNFIFNSEKDTVHEENLVSQSIKENLVDKGFYINLLKEETTEEDLDKVFRRFEEHETSFLATYQSILNTMRMLAAAGQISPDYLTDKEKLFKHGLMISKANSCFFNHLITTGSIFLEPIRVCRLLCNGALDVAEKDYFDNRKNNRLHSIDRQMREENNNHGKHR